jgi:hypothetical protein
VDTDIGAFENIKLARFSEPDMRQSKARPIPLNWDAPAGVPAPQRFCYACSAN